MTKSKVISLTMRRDCVALLATLLAAITFQACAQTSNYEASIRGKMHVPTKKECQDALNSGQVLGRGVDGKIMVAKGDVVYWIEITPTYIDCEAARFPVEAE